MSAGIGPSDLRAVVRSAALRLVLNPAGRRMARGDVVSTGEGQTSAAPGETYGIVDDFTLAELMILNKYRRRTWP